MNDPRRFLDGPGHDAERELLLSASGDEGSDAAYRHVRMAMGIGAAASLGTSASAAAWGARLGGGKAGVASMATLAKWAAVGAVAGALTVGTVELTSVSTDRSAAEQRAASRSTLAGPNVEQHGSSPRLEAPAVDEPEPVAPRAPSMGPGAPTPSRDHSPTSPSVEAPPTSGSVGSLPDVARRTRDDRLAEEVRLVDAARAAISAHDPRTALALAADHDRRFPNGTLGVEVAILRLQAFVAAGRTADASAEAARLLALHPTGPYATRIREIAAPSHNR